MGNGGQQRAESRISWRTLAVASGASVAAAFVVSSLWAPGTLIGAAVTPVIVALVSELLRKPIEVVPAPSAALSPLLPRTGGGPAAAAPEGDDVRAAPIDPPPDEPDEPDEPVVREYARSDYRTWDRRRIRLALVTGGLAFLIAVGFFVVADLTTGSAVTGSGGGSSLFSPRKSGGDGGSRPSTTTTTPRETTTQPPQTTQTAPPAQETTEQPPATTPTTPEPAPRTTEEPAAPEPAPAPAPATPPSGEAAPQQQPAP
jgi:hypothetical protein